MCHDGTGLRSDRAEARFWGVVAENRPPQTAQERRSDGTRTNATLENRPICAGIVVPLQRAWRRAKPRRSGSKSGSGRWSHWDEIGWVHYPEIGWSHSNEIRWVQSREILQPVPERVLPTADEPVVITNGAVPMNALQVIGAGIRHDDAGARSPSRTPATADAKFVIKVGRGIDDDAREVLGESPCR